MTPQGAVLADRHRVAQGQIGAATVAQILRLFPLLMSGGTIDTNSPRWLELAIAITTAQRARSAALAAQFATAFRLVESGTLDGFAATPALTLPTEAVTTSLMVLGPQSYRREIAKQIGVDTKDLDARMLRENRLPQGIQLKLAANTARAAMRHAQNGGRDTLDDVMKNDAAVLGYVRTTSATPCWFCAMLASRGPVYDDDSFADSDPRFQGPGDQKVHDGCGCMLLPMYRRAGEQWPGRAKEFDALWREHPSALKFRQAYEGRLT
jgi:hypothetical protein